METQKPFRVTQYQPKGDQAQAIRDLVRGLDDGEQHQVLLGVTGSGKTYTMAKVIERMNRPALVLAHNKTLAAQLCQEFRSFFRKIPWSISSATTTTISLKPILPLPTPISRKKPPLTMRLTRCGCRPPGPCSNGRDCIIVASVSCIYGIGSPEAYYGMLLFLDKGERIQREQILKKLVEIQYERSDDDFRRGTFRVRGDRIEVFPAYDDQAYRIELFGMRSSPCFRSTR